MDKKRHQYLMHLDKHPHRMETNAQDRQEKIRIQKNLNITEKAIKELNLTSPEATELKYLIQNTTNLKQFHSKASNKRIIYAIGIIIRERRRPDTKFKKLNASWDNKIDNDFLRVIQNNLITFYQRKSPLPFECSRYDHDLLSRNGGKI